MAVHEPHLVFYGLGVYLRARPDLLIFINEQTRSGLSSPDVEVAHQPAKGSPKYLFVVGQSLRTLRLLSASIWLMPSTSLKFELDTDRAQLRPGQQPSVMCLGHGLCNWAIRYRDLVCSFLLTASYGFNNT